MNVAAEIVGDSSGIRRLREQVGQILTRAATAPRPPAILLRGETGTGKGLVARTIHRAGPRARGPFVDVNCAAIPEHLLEAELFGYERGAFTDARQAKPGLFELAHRGMLFLDEIGMLAPAPQAKLLKVLDDQAVRRLGGTRAAPVDVWIVSATNEDLAEALRARTFREDLYHRLAVLSLELPPLRERGADIVLLAERFLARACADYGLPAKTFARDARAALGAYAWPGNVRELQNLVERLAVLTDDSTISAAMLAFPVATTVEKPRAGTSVATQTSRDRMRAHLLEMLGETGWNISQTAVRLGVARNTVLARIARFGLNRSTAARAPRSRPGNVPAGHAAATAPTDVPVPLLVAPSRGAWEPRRVALLRVDVVFDAAAGPGDASRTLDDMLRTAQTFGGEIVELGRAALVAAFGLQAVEDAPVRAALAALAILEASGRARRDDAAGTRVKIVVHVAQVLVSEVHGAGTIDGESKRAAWTTLEALAGLAHVDTVVVSEACAPFVERRFEITPASTDDALSSRRLLRREWTGFGLGGRALSRFVGRDAELRLVTDRMTDAARGHGQVVAIVGEPGVGKSRFVYELTRIDAMHGWRVLGCGGVSYGSTTPFLPVSDLLRRYFAIEDADGPEGIRDRVTDAVLSRHEALAPCLAPLLSLLDIPVDEQSWNSLDPPQRRQHMQDAMKRLVLNESRIHPLLLVIEDLHWVDAETRALLDSLVDSVPRARVVLLVTYRPEYPQTWSHKTYYTQIRIDPLAAANARMVLGALLGEHETLDPLKRLLIERTEGNPLFLEESVRVLVESRSLEGDPGAYRATRTVEVVEVPVTVSALLAARINRLRSDERRLLQSAAVIGRDVPFAMLRAIADQNEDRLGETLARLQTTEFLYEARIFPDREYTFKHALTHEVAYGSLPEDRRRALHAAIVDAIEALYADRLGEHVERLADHALLGDLRERAVPYLRQAGLKATARSALPDALVRFERALRILDMLPETRSTLEQGFEIHLELRTVLNLLGDGRAMLQHVRDAAHLAERLNDDQRRGQVCVLMTHIHPRLGEPDEGVASGIRALELAERLGDSRLRIPAMTYLAQAYYYRGEYERVVALTTDNLAALPAESVPDDFGLVSPPSVVDRCALVLSLIELGRFAEAAEPEAEAIRLATLTRNAFTLGWAHVATGWVRLVRGDWAQARAFLEHATGVLSAGNVTALLSVSVAFFAWGLAQLGEASGALSRLREGERLLEHQAASGYIGHLGWGCLALGRAALLLGRLDDARRLADLAVESSPRQPGFAAHALHLLGDVATHRDRFDAERGESHYRQAVALAEPRGMRPLVAHCRAGLGRLYRRTGRTEEAQPHLASAIAMYGEMRMTSWVDTLERD